MLNKTGILNLCTYFQYTKDDPFECEPCNCHGHSDKCEYDAEVDAASLSLDIDFNYEGGGVCQECQHNTRGINCHECVDTFYRPEGVLPNATEPCIGGSFIHYQQMILPY